MAINTKFRELELSMWQFLVVKVVLRKTHLKIQKTPTRPPNSTSGERISREIFEISKKFLYCLKLFLRPILFHGKLSFDNLTYFKLYGNLKVLPICHPNHFSQIKLWF